MNYLQIALNVPLNQTFTYSHSPTENNETELENLIGKRAEVRFGNRKLIGFIASASNEIPKECPVPKEKIRPITKIIDSEPIFNKEILDIAKWISTYYICSIGEVLSSILPSGKRETSEGGFSFELAFQRARKRCSFYNGSSQYKKMLIPLSLRTYRNWQN